jgi:adenylate cyclase
MTDIVMDSSGTLDKYIGDAVMAFWGAHIELPNNALETCKAAVRMMEL